MLIKLLNSFSSKKIIKHSIFIINSIWAIPLLIFIRIIYPIFKIKIIQIRSDRIGHFALDSMEIYCKYLNSKRTSKHYFFVDGPISNYFWLKLIQRKLKITPLAKYIFKCNKLLFGGTLINGVSSYTESRDIYGLFYSNNIKIPFTDEENNFGYEWLKSFGWSKGEKFVCLLVRDQAYLDQYFKNLNWDYHKFRNSNINTYSKGVKWLSKQNVWVFRMGKNVASQFKLKDKKIIDYPYCNYRSDFLDVWLFANCDACISTGSGMESVSHIYKKPILHVNMLPMNHINSFTKCMFYPKHLYWETTNTPLSIKEYFTHSHNNLFDYKKNGITIKDMTEDEILVAIKEFWTYFQCNSNQKVNTKKQKLFWDILFKYNKDEKLKFHGWKHPQSFIGNSWIISKT